MSRKILNEIVNSVKRISLFRPSKEDPPQGLGERAQDLEARYNQCFLDRIQKSNVEIAELEAAIVQDPNDWQARYLLGSYYMDNEELEKAREHLSSSAWHSTDPEIKYASNLSLGILEWMRGHNDYAATHLIRSIAIAEEHGFYPDEEFRQAEYMVLADVLLDDAREYSARAHFRDNGLDPNLVPKYGDYRRMRRQQETASARSGLESMAS